MHGDRGGVDGFRERRSELLVVVEVWLWAVGQKGKKEAGRRERRRRRRGGACCGAAMGGGRIEA